MMSRKKKPPTKKKWIPLRRAIPNPSLLERGEEAGVSIQVFVNDRYQVIATEYSPGQVHLDIKRNDRQPIANWRHLQQIKNEVCGTQSEGVQLFPAESRLLDEANSYHLYVLLNPPYDPSEEPLIINRDTETGHLEVGHRAGSVLDDRLVAEFNAGRERGDHRGRQEPFDEEGIAVGRHPQTPYAEDLGPYATEKS